MKIIKRSLIASIMFSCLVGGVVALGTLDVQAAKAPMSQDALEKESNLIVTGEVVSMTSKVQRSKYERSFGIHRDRVYTIKLKVTSISKGTGVKRKQEIVVEAWKPSIRFPALPGLQGHVPLPGKGDTVKMYLLRDEQSKMCKPLLPNGIDIKKKAK